MKFSRLGATLNAFALAGLALQTAAGAAPDPSDPAAAVPPLVHRSAFVRPPAGAASGPIGWPEANERVGRIGGWRAYAREAQAGAASAPAHRQ